MSRRESFDALVIGGGAVALAGALALGRAGMNTALVLDQEPPAFDPSSPIDLRVYALAPDVCEWLAELGVWSMIAAQRHCPYLSMQVWDAYGSGALHFAAQDYGWPALGTIVEHKLLCAALMQAVLEQTEISIVPGLVEHITSAGEHNSVSLAGKTLRGRLIVAADGAESKLRQQLGIATSERDYQQSALVATLSCELPHQFCAWQRFLPEGPIAMLPLANGQLSMVWTLPSARATALAQADEDVCRTAIQAAFGNNLGQLALCSARRTAPLRLRLAQQYVKDQVVLAGDAAHLVHPLAGQGLNLGLRDLQCLVRELSKPQSSGNALRRYERERKSENVLAAHGIDSLQRLFGPARGPYAWSRSLGLSALDLIKPAKQLFAELASGKRAGL